MSRTVLPWLILSTFAGQCSAFPSTFAITDDVALQDVLNDIPFFSVGLVGFAVFTFFFVMRRLNRLAIYIHLSIVIAFVASIFDLSQLIRRGSYNTQNHLGFSSVKPLITLREVGLALSVTLRYLFFWSFIKEPPRGELPLLPLPDTRRPNFISLESDSTVHSGSWKKWSALGVILNWGLLLGTVAILVLQILWRLVTPFMNGGAVYLAESGLEIILSATFVLKLLANSYLSPLTPRWKTVRDYSPAIAALVINAGVGAGNIFCFLFSETSVGRLLQATEMYILILFVLISAFYKMPVRSSVVAELVRRRLGSDLDADNNRRSMFSMIQRPMSTVTGGMVGDNSRNRPSISQRISGGANSIFSSKLLSRRNSRPGSGGSGGKAGPYGVKQDGEGDDRRLWDQGKAELGQAQSPVASMRASMEQTPNQTPVTEMQTIPGWRDPVFTSIVVKEEDAPPPMPGTAVTSVPSSATLSRQPSLGTIRPNRKRMSSIPDIIQIESPDTEDYPPTSRRSFAFSTSEPFDERVLAESPVYGLDGIVRNLTAGDTLRASGVSEANSDVSTGLDSLLRQQQELDRSIAGLRRFSGTSTRFSAMGGEPESVQSAFTLSNFPDIPFLGNTSPSLTEEHTVAAKADTSQISLPLPKASSSKDNGSLIVDDVPFKLLAPRMPAAVMEKMERQQPQSIPSLTRESLESVIGSRGVRMDSQGTQYDVTSFIGHLTTPAGTAGNPVSVQLQQKTLGGISEGSTSSNASDTDSVVDPATIAGLTRVTVLDRRMSQGTEPASLTQGTPLSAALYDEFDVAAAGGNPETSTTSPINNGSRIGSPTSRVPFVRPRGLPTGVRGRLEISNPIPRDSGVLNERTMFERPRPAPLVLQGPNDTSRAVVAPAEATSNMNQAGRSGFF